MSAADSDAPSLKGRLPWQAKLLAKLVMARLPLGAETWARLGLFKPGRMAEPDYARQIFRRHLSQAALPEGLAGKRVLELGPGDSLMTAVIAKAEGTARCLLVDVDRFAVADLAPYRQLAETLRADGKPAPDLSGVDSLEALLAACDADYLTGGLQDLEKLPEASVDLLFSHAVLEHVGLAEFDAVTRAQRRLLTAEGAAAHRVDLSDHLGGALNSLRFSPSLWESRLMAGGGFYTNRIRFRDMLERFARAGLAAAVTRVDRWPDLPTPRASLDPAFRDLAEEDLMVHGFDVVLRRA